MHRQYQFIYTRATVLHVYTIMYMYVHTSSSSSSSSTITLNYSSAEERMDKIYIISLVPRPFRTGVEGRHVRSK